MFRIGGLGGGVKRKLEHVTEKGDVLQITPLGAGSEVGRSCILLEFKEKKIMLDCGIHPGKPGEAGLPFFDTIELDEIDLLLVSHFHIDHCAALPYLLEKTDFKAKVFMTPATKIIYKLLLSDFVKVSSMGPDKLYDEKDLDETMDKITVVDFHQEVAIDGVRFRCFHAGHVLGAAMFLIEIAGVYILYTGDYSRQEDRHLMAAEDPGVQPDVLIVESTYGVQNHEPREDREARFTRTIHETLSRGGHCLIPVFALGRAQELLLILEEYWEANPNSVQKFPIYYASALAKKCMDVYETFIGQMNDRIKRLGQVGNPFRFNHIRYLSNIEDLDDSVPSVVMASPGMLQTGHSRQLFERWCSSKKNGVLLPGYCVEGTLAKQIITMPDTIKSQDGKTLPLRMSVDYISFSAHCDFQQTRDFVDMLKPPHIVLVHGDSAEMNRLRAALVQRYEGKRKCDIYGPRNCQTVELEFRGTKMAKVVGRLATEVQDGQPVSGVLVEKDFTYHVIAADELSTYSHLTTSKITQKQKVPFTGSFDLVEKCIREMYEGVKRTKHDDVEALLVHDSIIVAASHKSYLHLKWSSSPVTDLVADSVLSVILQIEGNPATQALIEASTAEDLEKLKIYEDVLASHFPSVAIDEQHQTLTITSENSQTAVFDYQTEELHCDDDAMRKAVQQIVERVTKVLHPL
mmetsp:Transcript_16116/g.62848  ORF Transcript_16116/g.62848 Transcript_16116/m.62848 type:complete len:687 (+) Transcript_16116:16-2076(+)